MLSMIIILFSHGSDNQLFVIISKSSSPKFLRGISDCLAKISTCVSSSHLKPKIELIFP